MASNKEKKKNMTEYFILKLIAFFLFGYKMQAILFLLFVTKQVSLQFFSVLISMKRLGALFIKNVKEMI